MCHTTCPNIAHHSVSLAISHNLRHDNDLSYLFYKDFINGMTDDIDVHYHENSSRLFIGDCNALQAPLFKKSQLTCLKRDDLVSLHQLILNAWYGYYDSQNKQSLVDDLMAITYLDFANVIGDEKLDLDDLNGFNCPDVVTALIGCAYRCHGHSQGDLVLVYDWTKEQRYTDSSAKRYLENVFWNSPINGAITVTANDMVIAQYEVTEYLNNAYDWDKDEFVQSLTAYIDRDNDPSHDWYKSAMMDFLQALPTQLVYA